MENDVKLTNELKKPLSHDYQHEPLDADFDDKFPVSGSQTENVAY